MKKIFFIALAMVAFITTSAAQQGGIFSKGDMIMNLGVGVGGDYYYGSGYKTAMPLISASFEYGIKDHLFDDKSAIGIGGYLAYTENKYEYFHDYGSKYSHLIVGGRGVFHYQFIDKLDTYAGLMLGYDLASHKYYGNYSGSEKYSVDSNSVAYSAFAGARYYFAPKFSAFAEAGHGAALLQLGVSIKF